MGRIERALSDFEKALLNQEGCIEFHKTVCYHDAAKQIHRTRLYRRRVHVFQGLEATQRSHFGMVSLFILQGAMDLQDERLNSNPDVVLNWEARFDRAFSGRSF